MSEKETLVGIVQKLVADEAFRQRVMLAPRETLMTDLGISGETYDALMTIVPAVLVGGLFFIGNGFSPEKSLMWGGWGRR